MTRRFDASLAGALACVVVLHGARAEAGAGLDRSGGGEVPLAGTIEPNMRTTLQSGEAPQLALSRSRLEARAAELRQAWVSSGPRALTAAPSIISGKLITRSINTIRAPAAPKFSIKFAATAGLATISATFMSQSAGQYLLSGHNAGFGIPAPTSGTIDIQEPFMGITGDQGRGGLSLYAAPGTWTLVSLSIIDKSGTTTTYDQSQIAGLFPGGSTITVTNPASPDTTAPLVTAGKVLTPTVHLSSAPASFGARMTVSDDISGVVLPCVFVQPPGATTPFCATEAVAAPVTSGTVESWTYIGGFGQTGTGAITGYELCDAAGNCLVDSNAADVQALFGRTTFTVAN